MISWIRTNLWECPFIDLESASNILITIPLNALDFVSRSKVRPEAWRKENIAKSTSGSTLNSYNILFTSGRHDICKKNCTAPISVKIENKENLKIGKWEWLLPRFPSPPTSSGPSVQSSRTPPSLFDTSQMTRAGPALTPYCRRNSCRQAAT